MPYPSRTQGDAGTRGQMYGQQMQNTANQQNQKLYGSMLGQYQAAGLADRNGQAIPGQNPQLQQYLDLFQQVAGGTPLPAALAGMVGGQPGQSAMDANPFSPGGAGGGNQMSAWFQPTNTQARYATNLSSGSTQMNPFTAKRNPHRATTQPTGTGTVGNVY